jgi:hypothetical protein
MFIHYRLCCSLLDLPASKVTGCIRSPVTMFVAFKRYMSQYKHIQRLVQRHVVGWRQMYAEVGAVFVCRSREPSTADSKDIKLQHQQGFSTVLAFA